MRGAGDEDEAGSAGAAARRFSEVGVVSVACLIATGLVNSWYLVGGVPGLLGTSYGRLLLLKLCLFAAMLAVATANRRRWTPMLTAERDATDANDAQRGFRRLKRNAGLEAALDPVAAGDEVGGLAHGEVGDRPPVSLVSVG